MPQALCLFILSVLHGQFHDLIIFCHDIIIILRYMRQFAIAAILTDICNIFEISAALIAQCIQWAIAEQAIETVRIVRGMTGKILAVFVIEKAITVFRLFFHFIFSLPAMLPVQPGLPTAPLPFCCGRCRSRYTAR